MSSENIDPEEQQRKAEEKAAKEIEAAKVKQEKEKVKMDNNFQSFLGSFGKYLKSLTSLKEGIDHEGTANGIRNDVEFRGHAAWVLVCSIFIACLGLNTNSAAIIIGAMLISPLMGPILGVGFAAGTNDGDLLMKSLKNFGSTILISLFISWLYFTITPFKELNEELFSRTSATIYAIAVAFTGGAAGIIAGSRPSKSNVVPGVAIATALMPPLCTAGYGLALGNWEYFFGAFYLFFINSVFIALPTYLYIRYLRFPVKQFVDPQKERKIKNYILIFILVVMVPSVMTFYNVLQNSIREQNISKYMSYVEQEAAHSGAYFLSPSYVNEKDSLSCTIHLKGETLSEEKIDALKKSAAKFDLIEAAITIVQDKDLESVFREFSRKENSAMSEKDRFINALEAENSQLKRKLSDLDVQKALFRDIEGEMSTLFPNLKYGILTQEEGESAKLMYTWSSEVEEGQVDSAEVILQTWLPKRLVQDSVEFRRFD